MFFRHEPASISPSGHESLPVKNVKTTALLSLEPLAEILACLNHNRNPGEKFETLERNGYENYCTVMKGSV